MYKQRKINIVGLFLTLILGLYIFVKYQWVGFPDGTLYGVWTDFQRTVLYPLFFLINTPFAIYFLWSLIKRKGNQLGDITLSGLYSNIWIVKLLFFYSFRKRTRRLIKSYKPMKKANYILYFNIFNLFLR